MFKRILALMLSLVLLAAVLPVSVGAESMEGELLCQRIEDHYLKALEANESESLSGYCGVLASYQLYFLGINAYPIMANGNDQYDIYAEWGYTHNGYRVKKYPAEEYTLEEALNAITHGGIWDAYNILVGFQATNTQAGAKYGHAVVIYGIVDGMVYFTESYGTAYFEEEGMPGVCTISQFVALYDSWTTFEGVILFGQKSYLDNCYRYDANMYVQAKKKAPLLTMPCQPAEDNDCQEIRKARKGEYLYVTGLYQSPDGRYYYQVQENEKNLYVAAGKAHPAYFLGEDITVSELQYPQVLQPGKDFTLEGKISSTYSLVGSVTMTVTDASGEVVLTHSRARRGGAYDLSRDTFNPMVNFGTLEEGFYTYTLTAQVQSHYLEDDSIETGSREVTICNALFAVGEDVELPEQVEIAPRTLDNGWAQREGVWCYYENGAPRTGWFCVDGVDYYLKEDGTPTTGWAEINGKMRYFAPTGAMCTGWLRTEEGTWYLLKNGQIATGWRMIGKQRYYFDENGNPLSGWQTIEGKTYYFSDSGCAATGWVELKDGTYYFHTDGTLLAKAIIKGDDVSYEMLTDEDVEIPPLPQETEE